MVIGILVENIRMSKNSAYQHNVKISLSAIGNSYKDENTCSCVNHRSMQHLNIYMLAGRL